MLGSIWTTSKKSPGNINAETSRPGGHEGRRRRKIKVREVIKIKEWVDGSGYNYEEIYSDKLVDVDVEEEVQENFSWDWWEKDSSVRGNEDLRIIVEYYRVSDDTMIAKFEAWQSEI